MEPRDDLADDPGDGTGGGSVLMLLVTVAHAEEGERISRELVHGQLAACGVVVPGVTSLYRWQGSVERSAECLLLVKTTRARAAAATARVVQLHSYELPCVLEIPVSGGHAAYLDWVRSATADPGA